MTLCGASTGPSCAFAAPCCVYRSYYLCTCIQHFTVPQLLIHWLAARTFHPLRPSVRGTIRVECEWIPTPPYVGHVRCCFLRPPSIASSLEPLGAVDVAALPGIGQWVKFALRDSLLASVCFPNWCETDVRLHTSPPPPAAAQPTAGGAAGGSMPPAESTSPQWATPTATVAAPGAPPLIAVCSLDTEKRSTHDELGSDGWDTYLPIVQPGSRPGGWERRGSVGGSLGEAEG